MKISSVRIKLFLSWQEFSLHVQGEPLLRRAAEKIFPSHASRGSCRSYVALVIFSRSEHNLTP